MRIFLWITGLCLLGLAPAQAAKFPAESVSANKNACVECHQSLTRDNKYMRHSFMDWEKSPHAKTNASCQDCHGGSPTERDVMKAHKDILRSTLPQSPVYFKNIPKTCGRCHTDELKHFRRSKHFAELQRIGKGPTCTTCHGTMSATVIPPDTLEQTCSLCHRNPLGAQGTLAVLKQAEKMLSSDTADITRIKGEGKDVAALDKELQAAKDQFKQAQRVWHDFDLKESKKQSTGALNKAKALKNTLEKYYSK